MYAIVEVEQHNGSQRHPMTDRQDSNPGYYSHVRNCWQMLAMEFPSLARRIETPDGRPPAGAEGSLARCQTAVAALGELTKYMSPEEAGPVHGARLGDPSHIAGRLLTMALQLEHDAISSDLALRLKQSDRARDLADQLRSAAAALQSSAEQVATQTHTIEALRDDRGELARYIVEHHQPGQVDPEATAICDGHDRDRETTQAAALRLLKLAAARGAFKGEAPPAEPGWTGGDVIDARPAIRCWPAAGVVFAGPEGPVLSIDPCDGGNVSLVHLGDAARWSIGREATVIREVLHQVGPRKPGWFYERYKATRKTAAHSYMVDTTEPVLPVGPVLVVAHYRDEHMCSATLNPERKPATIAPWGSADLDIGLHGLTQIVCERGGHLALLLVEHGGVMDREPIVLRHGTSFTAGETTLHFLRDEPLPPAFYEDEQVVSLAAFKGVLARQALTEDVVRRERAERATAALEARSRHKFATRAGVAPDPADEPNWRGGRLAEHLRFSQSDEGVAELHRQQVPLRPGDRPYEFYGTSQAAPGFRWEYDIEYRARHGLSYGVDPTAPHTPTKLEPHEIEPGSIWDGMPEVNSTPEQIARAMAQELEDDAAEDAADDGDLTDPDDEQPRMLDEMDEDPRFGGGE